MVRFPGTEGRAPWQSAASCFWSLGAVWGTATRPVSFSPRPTRGPSLTLAARWNGRAWLAEPTPSRGHDGRLDGVSCASAISCVAVGAPGEVRTGTRWTVIASAGPMSSVSCAAPGFCQTVGPPPYGRRPDAARWDGRTWQAEPLPAPQARAAKSKPDKRLLHLRQVLHGGR